MNDKIHQTDFGIELDEYLQLAKAGDKEGLNQLCAELENYMKSIRIPDYYFQGYGKEDLIQDTIMIVLNKIENIDSGLKSYTYRVMKNIVGDNLRRKYGRKALDMEKDKAILNEFGRVEEKNLKPIIAELKSEMLFSSTEDATSSVNLKSIFKLLSKIKKICRLYLQAIIEDCVDQLYVIYQQIHPGHSKNSYYVQLCRCRDSIRTILKREDLI